MKQLLLLFACTVLVGCDRGSSEVSVSLDRIDSFEVHETDSLYVGDFLAMHYGPDSLFWTTDYIRKQLFAFDKSGEIVQTVGREGNGPGEFSNLMHAIHVGNRLLTKERFGYTFFNSSYDYQGAVRLPEGTVDESFWGLASFNEWLLVGGTELGNGTSIQAQSSDPAVLVLDSTFSLIFAFGQFPQAYQNNKWTMRDRDVAVNIDGMVAVVFRLSSEIHFYNLGDFDANLLEVVNFDSETFRAPDVTSTVGQSREEQIQFLERTSLVNRVFFTSPDNVVVYYSNPRENWDGQVGDDSTIEHYLVSYTLGNENVNTIRLPGPLLGVDGDGVLLIRLSNSDKKREIGRFKLRSTIFISEGLP